VCEHGCPLDFVLRATFEWRELANLQATFVIVQPPLRSRHRGGAGAADEDAAEEDFVAETTRRSAFALAHQSRPFAKHVVELLGRLHGASIDQVRDADAAALAPRTRDALREQDVGLFWALLSDPRPEISKLARAWQARGIATR